MFLGNDDIWLRRVKSVEDNTLVSFIVEHDFYYFVPVRRLISLFSVGVDADEEKLNKVISELSGKAIDDVLAEGKEKLASVPSGGGAAPAAGGAAAAAGGDDAPAAEAKKESSSEDEDEDMGFGLFD